MLEKIKEKYFEEKNLKVQIKVRDIPLSFSIIKEPTNMDKMSMVETALNVSIIDDVDTDKFDRNIANKILEFLIIQNCTDLQLLSNENNEEDTILKIFEALDILGEKGVKDILEVINASLNVTNLYQELSSMLDNNIKEYYKIREFRNSFLSRIINLISNTDLENFDLLKNIEPQLSELMKKIDMDKITKLMDKLEGDE